jgi:DNA-binding NtrC family response regulator
VEYYATLADRRVISFHFLENGMMRSVILLSRRHRLYSAAASWDLPDVELYLFDSPSEALAKLSLGKTAVFLFDTRDYPRFKHVLRKFGSMKNDADLVMVGQDAELSEIPEPDLEVAVRALPSDVPVDEIREVVLRLLQLRRVRERSGIVGRSRSISELLSLVAHAAPMDVNILILGESGTGKELVARAIHDNSSRAEGPFISLNCGAMSEGVLESELFGHARGAFTGAVAEHAGVFKRADGGTLFLDEVAEMPLGMQTRFLRALETGEFTPVGGRAVQTSNIRLVAATHRDLAADVAQGAFRQDLYYRLRVVVINTPALRDRREDIPVLTAAFLAQENERHGLHVRGLTRAAEQALAAHDWPGNVRELRNTISSLVVMKQRGMIDVGDLPVEFQVGGGSSTGFLPVPMTMANSGNIDLGVLATSILELRRDIQEIKGLLLDLSDREAQGGGWPLDPGGRLDPSGRVEETFSGGGGFSPLAGEQAGDLQTAEKALMESALKATGGNRRLAAERLGISERTLYRKIKLYGLD